MDKKRVPGFPWPTQAKTDGRQLPEVGIVVWCQGGWLEARISLCRGGGPRERGHLCDRSQVRTERWPSESNSGVEEGKGRETPRKKRELGVG